MEQKTEIQQLGLTVKAQLNMLYKQWNKPMTYKAIFPSYAPRAKKMGLELSQFTEALEELGLIKIIMAPSGKRWVFSTDSKLSEDDMVRAVLEEENQLQIGKDLKKLAL